MTNLDSIFKSRDITLPTKVHLVKVMVFPVVTYGCESWTVKKAERRRIDALELWCWRSENCTVVSDSVISWTIACPAPLFKEFSRPKCWSFSFSIIPSKEIPGLISFRMDRLDLLESKGLSRVFSNTTGQRHQFSGAQPSSPSNSHIHT